MFSPANLDQADRRTEYELVLAVLRSYFDPGSTGAATALLRHFGEPAVRASLKRARRLEVRGLHAIQLSTYSDIPAWLSEASQAQRAENLARNVYLRAETERWIARLRGEGIEAVPIKGVAFSRLLYGDVGAKTCADVDLWVRSEDLDRAGRYIAARGWTRHGDPPGSRWSKAQTYVDGEGPGAYAVDLHWRLESPAILDLGEPSFWEDGGRVAKGLPLDLVGALLCAHVWRHGVTLKTLLDFAAFAHRYPSHLPAARARLERAHAGDGFDLALALAARNLGVSVAAAHTGIKRILLPSLDGCLRISHLERGPYANQLILPLQRDGLIRPLAYGVRRLFRSDGDGAGHGAGRFGRLAGAIQRFAASKARFFTPDRANG